VSEINEIRLPDDAEFPHQFQGNWIGEELDVNGDLETIEISGRTLKWCGRKSDFEILSMHQDENGKIEAMQMECDPSHPDALNWSRYNVHFVIPQENGESIMIANDKIATTLHRVSS
jgi:hypothetical protein